MRAWLMGVGAMVLSACGHPPQLEPDDRPFAGIDTVGQNSAVIRILAIHGACHRDGQTWMSQIRRQLAEYLALPDGPVTRILDDPETRIRLYKTQLRPGRHRIELYGIVFSEATRPLKQRHLCQAGQTPAGVCEASGDADTVTPARRSAWLNGRIKNRLLNDCIADTVFYLGVAGEPIRRGVRLALRTVLQDAAPRAAPTILLSESLGSKILRDALLCVEPAAATEGFALFGTVATVFLRSNQIALLNNATVRDCAEPYQAALLSGREKAPALSGGIFDVIERVAARRGRAEGIRDDASVPPRPASVVAFNDPNDLLSYEVDPAHYGNIPVINVWVRNRTPWLGLYANPVGAHMGYLDNRDVLDILFCGHGHAVAGLCRRR